MSFILNIVNILGLISTFSPLLPLVAGAKRKPNLVWVYSLTGLVSNLLIGRVFRHEEATKTLIANCYVMAEFFLISMFFAGYFAGKRKMLVYVGCIVFLCCVYEIIRSEPYHSFNGFAAALLSFTYLTYCISSLYDIMLDHRIENVFHSSRFLFTIAFLVYFSGMFMLYASDRYFNIHEPLWHFSKHHLMNALWKINSLCNIAQSIIFAWAFRVQKKAAISIKTMTMYDKR